MDKHWTKPSKHLNKMALTFEPVDEILKCDHSNEACGTVYYAVEGGSYS